MSTFEEVIGVVGGLAEVVKAQQHAAKDQTEQAQRQLNHLLQAILDLSLSVCPKDATSSPLRLPQLQLPEFTGKEDLDRFVEKLTHVLPSSGVSSQSILIDVIKITMPKRRKSV